MWKAARWLMPGLVVSLCPMPLRGAVVASNASGFKVESTFEIAAAPQRIYDEIVKNTGAWWDPEHTFWGAAGQLSIDARPDGCFCETAPGGRGVRHMTVVLADPGKTLRMTGGLGPLQTLAVAGTLTFVLERSGDGTKLVLDYTVGGYAPGGLESWASPVDRVLAAQMSRLRNHVERGSPTKPER